jgi:mannitol/fructose-specific phosphotransferase system IIA component (Ntr-type)
MLLSEVFDARHIKLGLASATKDAVFEELVEVLAALHPELDRSEMLAAVTARESLMNTAIVPGIAVPHGCCKAVNGVVGVVGISREGIAYGTEDRQPVHCIFMMIMGASCREKHLQILSRLLSLFDSQVVAEIRAAENAQAVHDIIRRF